MSPRFHSNPRQYECHLVFEKKRIEANSVVVFDFGQPIDSYFTAITSLFVDPKGGVKMRLSDTHVKIKSHKIGESAIEAQFDIDFNNNVPDGSYFWPSTVYVEATCVAVLGEVSNSATILKEVSSLSKGESRSENIGTQSPAQIAYTCLSGFNAKLDSHVLIRSFVAESSANAHSTQPTVDVDGSYYINGRTGRFEGFANVGLLTRIKEDPCFEVQTLTVHAPERCEKTTEELTFSREIKDACVLLNGFHLEFKNSFRDFSDMAIDVQHDVSGKVLKLTVAACIRQWAIPQWTTVNDVQLLAIAVFK